MTTRRPGRATTRALFAVAAGHLMVATAVVVGLLLRWGMR